LDVELPEPETEPPLAVLDEFPPVAEAPEVEVAPEVEEEVDEEVEDEPVVVLGGGVVLGT